MFLFGIRCYFATLADGIRLYVVLTVQYELESIPTDTLAQIDEIKSEAAERLRLMHQKALKRLKPTAQYDMLRRLVRIAAIEILERTQYSSSPITLFETTVKSDAASSTRLGISAYGEIAIFDDEITLRDLQENINLTSGV